MGERWMPVVGYEDWYEVSDIGRVRSLHREGVYPGRWGLSKMTFPAREMRICVSTTGYRYLALKRPNEKAVKHLVHRLVLRAFLGDAPTDRPQVNHRDGDKSNNCLTNLEYASSAENLNHCIRVLGKKRGESAGNAKLTEAQVRAIRVDRRMLREIAADHGVSLQTIWKIQKGEAWAHVHG
jgi:hypothetical protein